MSIDYKSAGVDIAAGNEAVRRIKDKVQSTFSPHILSDLSSFGALIDLKTILQNYQHPVLVQSIDGVGTKTIIARMMNKYDTLGHDLLSATSNDILVAGATPLTLLDYVANAKLDPAILDNLVSGMVAACLENEVALVGGETAEMPDTYLPGENDMVGIVTGLVDKNKLVNGKNIVPGDKVLAFVSSGLHTNGYSLARKLFFSYAGFNVDSQLSELNHTLGEVLLEPHINYTRPVLKLLNNNVAIKGMAHITGGGLLENIPRILPANCAVEINKHAWPQQAVFDIMRGLGQLDDTEMYKTFNMGIGYVIIADESVVNQANSLLKDLPEFELLSIGEVVPGQQQVKLIS